MNDVEWYIENNINLFVGYRRPFPFHYFQTLLSADFRKILDREFGVSRETVNEPRVASVE